VGTVLDKIW